ncbi:MAG TPA: cyclic nucleotide-binding domain-containing protein [Marmoricola sp.]|jgi:cAMP-dependent protein kinase regulator/CRP/FNR family cyclic AMP-dependent transcriptional regulator/cGMP-dependent protein kinase 2|nr:cyclic nucleotide-binding domain-containing protein [Marmoricola sp.]
MLTDDLRLSPLFAGMTDTELERVAGLMEEKRVVRGAVLAREGEFAYHLVVVAEGTAEVIIDGETVRTLQAGDTFGEIGVVERGRRTADVMATSPMRLLTMRIWTFNTLADEMPEFGARAKELARGRREPTEG